MQKRSPKTAASSLGSGHGPLPAADTPLTLAEIREVLGDEGYSADGRKAWLKQVLTTLEQEASDRSQALAADVRKMIDSASTPIREKGGVE